MDVQKIFKIVRPIARSALLLFLLALSVQYIGSSISPSFNILASKDLGKIIFTSLAFLSLGFFVKSQSDVFKKNWFNRNLRSLLSKKFWAYFLGFFLFFFSLHSLFILICYAAGIIELVKPLPIPTISILGKILFGFFVTFMLGFTEEVIFRGTVYPYFVQWVRPIAAVFITSLLFMIVHFLPNPVVQIAQDAPIAIGLFLLGFMLNLIFIKAGTMAANIGTHAGLVFVKVILRKIRFLTFAPAAALPWFLHSDLRQAPIVHLLFGVIIIGLSIEMRKELFSIIEK